MELMHFLILLFFLSILLYLGLKNGNATVAILNSGGAQLTHETSVLQGR
jgi:hypothetical protein